MLKDEYSFDELVGLMALLRSENGCPWDRDQTHESLKKYLIEETYEVLEAVDSKDDEKQCEELGDLLLQVLFHARIAEEEGRYRIGDIISGIAKKLVMRHTHVFGGDKADTPDEVVDNWERIKRREKGMQTHADVLKAVPSNLPALMRSFKVQQKAALVGFDWDKTEDVFKKAHEELIELQNAYTGRSKEMIIEEIGDVLFSLVNLSRFLDVQPELALTGSTRKFIKRFEHMENGCASEGRRLDELMPDEMDGFWNKAKEDFR